MGPEMKEVPNKPQVDGRKSAASGKREGRLFCALGLEMCFCFVFVLEEN